MTLFTLTSAGEVEAKVRLLGYLNPQSPLFFDARQQAVSKKNKTLPLTHTHIHTHAHTHTHTDMDICMWVWCVRVCVVTQAVMILVWHVPGDLSMTYVKTTLFFFTTPFFFLSSLFSQVTVSDYSLTMSKIEADTDKNEEEEEDEPE